MALVVYDQGYRIQTPVSALFKPKGVDQLTELSRTTSLPESDDIARDEAKELEDALANAGRQSRQRRLPGAEQQPESPNTYGNSGYGDRERRKKGLTARQLMVSPVYTTRTADTLNSAAQKMQAHNIHHLAVVDEEGLPLGLLSDRDIEPYGNNSALPVSQAYQRQVIVAALDTELSVLAATFVNYPVRAIPVIDEEERVIGIITRSDLLRLLINNARVESWA
ncbi:CBS domain-containing protein [Marinobacterium sp. D7]|uniref:CBS domain-containing protein n=1 Tax=Marinobacterium ramblicola TaxID=2849041 RepID=UPI001C2D4A60|nr:CBS domain-containing protein [Marinobacterium ramblicola]MBV1789378.1 CBS domain-containing protein [Marinobacterium ramblicola]